ncbi:uncharacterized protein LOC101212475 isoform X2 [Cucumis sativus]|uniref:Uncharacterized protein n=1 Tax=Cucumis sativus TaxID=3659 RepID=A0A0A0L0N0_CUCSA|nr:uncharacterized protein LOC101212475 isoform X2 [Cucumis sativus]KGN54157.1 hypothetical protein Csa_018043 [Cucumis sativus]
MDDDHHNQENFFQSFPNLVSFASPLHTPSHRRLSSNFTQPRPPIPAPRRLSWVSLQGRLVNAQQASSVPSIGGGFGPDEAIAWQLFSPIERFLIVAVIGVAVSESKSNHQIGQLKRAVELRDQVLLSMQQKLDDLCNQVNPVKDQSGTENDMALKKNADLEDSGAFGNDKIKFDDCGCWLCDEHLDLLSRLEGNAATKHSCGAEMLQYKMPLINQAEQEERRMSDLSDWASSVTSVADIQMNTLSIEQDMLFLKKDCEEKDASIKELTNLLHSSEVYGSQRISELEDIIRRKNMIITKLKKDMVVLEQKVIQLTRLRRPSSCTSNSEMQPIPYMTDNLLYDMESSTSPSSSDSDCSHSESSQPPPTRKQDNIVHHIQKKEPCLTRTSLKSGTKKRPPTSDSRSKPQMATPLKEITSSTPSSRQRGGGEVVVVRGNGNVDSTNMRRRLQTVGKDTPQRKRHI